MARHKLTPLLQSTWAQGTPLSGLDKALAQWLHSQEASEDPRHLWLAALASHQWGRGHACLDLVALQDDASTLLGWSATQASLLPPELSAAAATLTWTQGPTSPLVLAGDAQGERLYLRRAWAAEQSIRQHIEQRLALPCEAPTDLQARLDALFPPRPPLAQAHEALPPLTSAHPADLQRQACEVAAQNRITLITGGPGTGKTTTVVKLLALLVGASAHTLQIHLAAPTGKAAARLSESIRQALSRMPLDVQARIPTQAQTLHRLLQIQRKHAAVPPLAADVVVVDEASMIDLEMMARLLQAVPPKARLILLGDKDQLASVEAGAVMAQLCTGPLLQAQTVTLTHSHRFDTDSGIGAWASAVNTRAAHNTPELKALWEATPDWAPLLAMPAGQMPPSPPQQKPDSHDEASAHRNAPPSDVTRWTLPSASTATFDAGLRHGWRNWLALLAALEPQAKPQQACTDAQALALLQAFSEFCVLCAVHEGPFGVKQLNAQAARALGFGPGEWYVGRPVMVTRNDYALGLMNGDVGLCLPAPDGALRVAFTDAAQGVRWVAPTRLDSVETVFAMTVHKSQGSEFAHVLLVLPVQDAPVLTRELVYTGLTRARERLTLWAAEVAVLYRACARRTVRSGGLS